MVGAVAYLVSAGPLEGLESRRAVGHACLTTPHQEPWTSRLA